MNKIIKLFEKDIIKEAPLIFTKMNFRKSILCLKKTNEIDSKVVNMEKYNNITKQISIFYKYVVTMEY